MCTGRQQCVFFPVVFDLTTKTLVNKVSRVAHLKLTWIFLQGFALLTHSHTFSRLVQTTAQDVFIRVKLLHQKYIQWRNVRQKDKKKKFNYKYFALFNLTSSTKIKKLDDIFKIHFLSISMYIKYISVYYSKI